MNYYFEQDVYTMIRNIFCDDSTITVIKNANEGSVLREIKNGELELPVINLQFYAIEYDANRTTYYAKNHEEDIVEKVIDIENVLVGSECIDICVYADSIEEITRIEKRIDCFIGEQICIESSKSGFDNCVVFHLFKDTSVNTNRKTIEDGGNIYISCLHTKSDDVAEVYREYHSAEIDLDRKVQLDLLSRYNCLYEYLFRTYGSGFSFSGEMQQIYKSIRKLLNHKLSQIMLKLQNHFPMLMNTNDVELIVDTYHLMKENNTDLISAIDSHESGKRSDFFTKRLPIIEQKKAEEVLAYVNERIENRKKLVAEYEIMRKERYETAKKKQRDRIREVKKRILETWGEPWVNMFVNEVADYLQKNISEKVFDSTKYMMCLKQLINRSINTPFILCSTSANLISDYTPFVEFEGNQQFLFQYGLKDKNVSYPLDVSICFLIYSDNESDIERIAGSIVKIFDKPKMLFVPDLVTNKNISVNVLVPKDKVSISTSSIGGKNYKIGRINTSSIKTVYYGKDYSDEDLKYDTRKQYWTLQKIKFYFRLKRSIESSIEDLLIKYRELSSHGSAPFMYPFSQDFIRLSKLIQGHRKNDEQRISYLFSQAFKNELMYYPYLFERFREGWTDTQVKNDINEILTYHKEKSVLLCNQLKHLLTGRHRFGLDENAIDDLISEIESDVLSPAKYLTGDKLPLTFWISNPVTSDDKDFYRLIEAEEKEDYKLIESVKPSWMKEKERKEKELKMAQEKDDAIYNVLCSLADAVTRTSQYQDVENATHCDSGLSHREHEYYNDESSLNRSGGIIGNTLSTAVGVALGNKLTGNVKPKRPDLIGSAGCQIGKFDGHFKQTCNFGCPLWGECSRGRGN